MLQLLQHYHMLSGSGARVQNERCSFGTKGSCECCYSQTYLLLMRQAGVLERGYGTLIMRRSRRVNCVHRSHDLDIVEWTVRWSATADAGMAV